MSSACWIVARAAGTSSAARAAQAVGRLPRQVGVDRGPVDPRQRPVHGLHEVVLERHEQAAQRRRHAGRGRDQRGDLDGAGQRVGVQRAGAAEGHEDELPAGRAALDRDTSDAGRHVVVRHGENRQRGVLDREPQRLGHASDRRARERRVEGTVRRRCPAGRSALRCPSARCASVTVGSTPPGRSRPPGAGRPRCGGRPSARPRGRARRYCHRRRRPPRCRRPQRSG